VTTLLKYQPPTYGDYHYDDFAIALGWGVALISFVPIPVMAAYQLMKARGSLTQVSCCVLPLYLMVHAPGAGQCL